MEPSLQPSNRWEFFKQVTGGSGIQNLQTDTPIDLNTGQLSAALGWNQTDSSPGLIVLSVLIVPVYVCEKQVVHFPIGLCIVSTYRSFARKGT